MATGTAKAQAIGSAVSRGSGGSRLRVLAELTKLRLVGLVVVTAAVGYLLGAGPDWSLPALLWTVLGTGLAAGGSMALNEWMERERDARMERTRHRPLPAGHVTATQAVALGAGSASAGVVLLATTTKPLTAILAVLIIATYLFVYTPLKPRTPLCTLAGAVCGAIPPMMGWSAATGRLDFGAWMLGGVLFLWQIPHFLALAWLYRDDYQRGGFRMLPAVDRSGRTTSHVVVLYSAALLPVTLTASLSGMAGWSYGAGSVVLSAGLLAFGALLARTPSPLHARRLFLATLVYLPLLLGLMVADKAPGEGRDAIATAPVARAAALPPSD